MTDFKIVKNATGSAMPGQATYIMGSSGAGKTSLLNILSDRITKNSKCRQDGKVWMNDKTELTQEVFGNVGVYVM